MNANVEEFLAPRGLGRDGLATALGPGRASGRFADNFGGHEARDKLFQAKTVEINCSAIGIGFPDDSESILLVTDVLILRESLHDILLPDRSNAT
jgi:hypothetical protein